MTKIILVIGITTCLIACMHFTKEMESYDSIVLNATFTFEKQLNETSIKNNPEALIQHFEAEISTIDYFSDKREDAKDYRTYFLFIMLSLCTAFIAIRNRPSKNIKTDP